MALLEGFVDEGMHSFLRLFVCSFVRSFFSGPHRYGYSYMPSPYGDYYGTASVPQQPTAPLPVIAPIPPTESAIEDIYFTESMDQVVKQVHRLLFLCSSPLLLTSDPSILQQNEEFVNANADDLVPVFYFTRTSSEFE